MKEGHAIVDGVTGGTGSISDSWGVRPVEAEVLVEWYSFRHEERQQAVQLQSVDPVQIDVDMSISTSVESTVCVVRRKGEEADRC